MFELFERAQTLLAERVPLADHIEDDVVVMKDNGVMAAYEVAGRYPDTAEPEDVNHWFDQLHGAWLNIAAEDIELNVYQCRGEADPADYVTDTHRIPFTRELSRAYLENLRRGTLYSNRLFLTVQVHAPSVTGQALSRFFADAPKDPRHGIDQRTARLKDRCGLLEAQLASFGLRRLGLVERHGILHSEIFESIAFAMTGKWRQLPLTTARLCNSMLSETIAFRNKRVEYHGAGDTTYAEAYTFSEYPAMTWPGMLHGLARAPYRNTLQQSFRFLSNTAAIKKVTTAQSKREIAGDKAFSQTAQLHDAADQLMSGRTVTLGDHSLMLLVFASRRSEMSDVGNAAWRDLATCGVVATRMTHTLQPAFLSMLPGGRFWQPRPGFPKSSNFVAFAPLYNYPAGHKRSHWPGPPIITLRSLGGTPIQFHWHPPGSDIGNTLVTGASGSGKTLLIGMLLAMTASRARVIALDHKRGWDFLIRHMRGDYAVLGAGQPNFAPLKALSDSAEDLAFLVDLFRVCIGGTMTEEEQRRLTIALRTVMQLPAALRSVGEVRAFLDDEPEGAGVRLEKWCSGADLGWVIDAPVDTVQFADLSGLDVTALLDSARARGVALLYLVYRIALTLTGEPVLITIDEGWRALIDPIMRALIDKLLRTIRSKNGAVVFITQSVDEMAKSGIGRVLVEQCQTQIHLANPRASQEDYCNELKLTAGQFDALKVLQGGQGYFLLVQGNDSVVAQLPMSGMEKFIPILSAREADLRRADRERIQVLEAAE